MDRLHSGLAFSYVRRIQSRIQRIQSWGFKTWFLRIQDSVSEDSVSEARGFRIQCEDSGFSVTEKRKYVTFSERTKITFVVDGFRATNNAIWTQLWLFCVLAVHLSKVNFPARLSKVNLPTRLSKVNFPTETLPKLALQLTVRITWVQRLSQQSELIDSSQQSELSRSS